jgi:hypothetical protein
MVVAYIEDRLKCISFRISQNNTDIFIPLRTSDVMQCWRCELDGNIQIMALRFQPTLGCTILCFPVLSCGISDLDYITKAFSLRLV